MNSVAEWAPVQCQGRPWPKITRGGIFIMSLVREMHRRNVFRVAALYLVIAWLLLKSSHVLIDLAGMAVWVRQMLEVVLAVGLPFAIWFSWAYEVTPQGLKKESDVKPDTSITSLTARKIDSAILIVLIIGAAVLILNQI